MIRKNCFFKLCLCSIILLIGCSKHHSTPITISISTNGHYAVSAHSDKKLVLWNIQNKTKRMISKHANVYSAYFIKDSNAFMWQDDMSNTVYIQNVNGQNIKSLSLSFPTYGHIISTDLKQYFAANKNWDIYYISPETTEDPFKQTKLLIEHYNATGFGNLGQMLHFSISNQRLLAAGNAGYNEGILVWDIQSKKVVLSLPKSFAQTRATFSPDKKYIVSGDVYTNIFVWETLSGQERFDLFNLEQNQKQCLLNIKFIDKKHYLRFATHTPQNVVLYQVDNLDVAKEMKLGRSPLPEIEDCSKSATIDTAPKANILVLAQKKKDGIIVYHYDAKTQTLQRTWTAHV
jgi:WD40 repeat protein